jgi:hypothetical protein
MVSTPEGAANATQQRKNQIRKHTVRELEKWKGMSSPTVKPKKTNRTKNITTTPVVPEPAPVPLDPSVRKHHVIQNLLNNGISMIPATVGGLGDFGPMLEMFLYGTFPPDVNYMTQLSTHRTGVKHTKEACLTARSRAPIKALLPSADQNWRKNFGRRWFGSTYQDMSPLPSSRKNIGIMISRELAYQISFGATKAASKFVSHNPPPRSRSYPVRPTVGRLPLSSDRDCYDALAGIITQPEILFDEVHIATRAPVDDFGEGELV